MLFDEMERKSAKYDIATFLRGGKKTTFFLVCGVEVFC